MMDGYSEIENEIWHVNYDELLIAGSYENVYLYGCGRYGRFALDFYGDNGISVDGFIVSDGERSGKNVCGLSVFELGEEQIRNANKEKTVVVICSGGGFSDAMKNNALKSGFKNIVILKVGLICPIPRESDSVSEQDVFSDMEDGILRLRITNRCPGRCDFCGQLSWSKEEQNLEMDPEWYMNYLKPLYPKLSQILITGGDAFSAKESYRYMDFISSEYPGITIMTESNGIPFDEKYQRMAMENLFSTHFSVNASNVETFKKGCWSGTGGERAYTIIRKNIADYLNLLKDNDRLEFAPNVSMVINSRTCDDVVDFIKMCLEGNLSYVAFYFDYTENDMSGNYFRNPEIMRDTLRSLMEIEKLLKGRFYIAYRLWVPLKELPLMEKQVTGINTQELIRKYADLWELSTGRNTVEEHRKRNIIRSQNKKRELTWNQDFSSTICAEDIHGRILCRNAWKMIDLYPSGRLDFCGWHVPILFLQDHIKNGLVDWDEIINSEMFRRYRAMMIDGDYSGCMDCCPVIK